MKTFMLALLALSIPSGSSSAAQADPKRELTNAVQALRDKTNYSWTSTTVPNGERSPWLQGPLNGKTEKNGDTYFAFSIEGNLVEAAFRGTRSAIRTDSAWETPPELTGDRLWLATRLRDFKAPAAEAEEMLNKGRNLRRNTDGSWAADLTAEVVKALLAERSRSGTQEGGPTETKGSVKFWVRNGLLEKYEYNLQGKIIVPDYRQEFAVNRTTTVEIKSVGSTRVVLPTDAAKKLSER